MSTEEPRRGQAGASVIGTADGAFAPPPAVSLSALSASLSNPLLPTAHHPSAHNGSLGLGLPGGPAVEVPAMDTKVLAIHEIFQRKQADLWISYQQAQANLAMQHLKFTQQLADATAKQDQPQGGDSLLAPDHRTLLQHQPTAAKGPGPLVNSTSLIHLPSAEGDAFGGGGGGGEVGNVRPLRRTFSHGSSGTISERTRQKLINVLEKKIQQKERIGGSPHFEPYPHHKGPQGGIGVGGMPPPPPPPIPTGQRLVGSDFELRKVSSEPNLKMRQKLREKLLRQRPGAPRSPSLGPSAFHSPPPFQGPLKSAPVPMAPPEGPVPKGLMEGAAGRGPGGEGGGGGQAFIFPSPSLPNLGAFPPAVDPFAPLFGGGGGMEGAGPGGLNPNLFLSMPSLFLNPAALGGPPPLGITLPLAGPRIADIDPVHRMSAADFAAGGRLYKDPRGQIPPSTGSHPNLLKQQLRDLVLRRKSLVREETEDEMTREVSVIQGRQTTAQFGIGGILGAGVTNKKTGLAYDSAMSKHMCMCRNNGSHVEHGGRIGSIWARLQERGLVEACERVGARKAPLEHLKLVHSDAYVTFFGISPTACIKMIETCRDTVALPIKNFVALECGGYGIDNDTYFNDACTQSGARLAVGHTTELALQVLDGRVLNGFAIVRPPGHHAEHTQAMGFCFFNNIAIAIKVVQQKVASLGRPPVRIAVVDWDVHHGNGIQQAFWDDPNVLYISLHRHDQNNFFPGTGDCADMGEGRGKYFTVNVGWVGAMMGDADYLAAWRVVLQPILEQFQPELVIVAAGFDGCEGHEPAIGGYHLTHRIFEYFTRQLMKFANGRVMLSLEGGYVLAAMCDAAEACVKALLTASDPSAHSGDAAHIMDEETLNELPKPEAQECLQKIVALHKKHWKGLSAEGINMSQAQWDAVSSRFASLSVKHPE